VTETTVRV